MHFINNIGTGVAVLITAVLIVCGIAFVGIQAAKMVGGKSGGGWGKIISGVIGFVATIAIVWGLVSLQTNHDGLKSTGQNVISGITDTGNSVVNGGGGK